MPITIGLTAKLRNKLLKRNAVYDVASSVHTVVDISYVFSGCPVIHYDAYKFVAWRLLLGKSVKVRDKKIIIIDKSGICTTWNVYKEDSFMTTIFYLWNMIYM